MRIPGQRVYRAFPELDRFSDEQCRRFVTAAKRDWWLARLVRMAIPVIVLVFAAAAVVVCGRFVWRQIAGRTIESFFDSAPLGVVLTVIVVCALVPLLSALIARDVLLRRTVRRVINDRSRCLQCGYSLLGLNVGEDLRVRCPECAEETEVDVSLGELAIEGEGKKFRPNVKITDRELSLAERKRRRRLAWTVAAAVGMFVLIPAGLYGVFELNLRLVAARAKREAPNAAAFNVLIKSQYPADLSDSDLAFLELCGKAESIAAAEYNAYFDSLPPPDPSETAAPYPDYLGILTISYGSTGPRRDFEERNKMHARKLVAMLESKGYYEEVAKAVRAKRTTYPLSGEAAVLEEVFGLNPGPCRSIANLLIARASVSVLDDDPERFLASMKHAHEVSEIAGRAPGILPTLMKRVIQGNIADHMRLTLRKRTDARWLSAVQQVMALLPDDIDMTYAIKTERLAHHLLIASVFSDIDKRRGLGLAGLRGLIDDKAMSSMGDYDGCMTAMRSTMDWLEANLKLPRSKRQPAPTIDESVYPRDEHGTSLSTVYVGSLIGSGDVQRTRVSGTRVLVAIERFRGDKGRYPAALTDLVPEYLPDMPLDPFSERPFVYRLVDPSQDALKRSFLLYSVGYDGTDDGGHMPPGTSWFAFSPSATERYDYVFNSSE